MLSNVSSNIYCPHGPAHRVTHTFREDGESRQQRHLFLAGDVRVCACAGTAKAAAATAPGENSHGSTLLEHAPTPLRCISSKWIGVTFRLFQGKQAERRCDDMIILERDN